MALVDYKATGPYLMGRLVNREGKYVQASRYFPLPFYTFSLDHLENETIKVNSKNGTATIDVKQDSPIAYSDLNGLIHYFSSQKDLQADDKLIPSMPASLAHSGSDVRKAIFFPPYLVPMAQASYQGDWLPELYNKLTSAQLDKSKVDFAPKKRQLNKLNFLDPDKALLNETTKAYKTWHGSAFTNLTESNSTIDIVEIPQLYTVVITFSSSQFENAEVTLSEFPEHIKITGDVIDLDDNHSVSAVREVTYSDEDNNEKKCYAATFWIETELLETPLQIPQQYCRFDVDLGTLDKDVLDKLLKYGLPEQYNLSEQVLHLPIQTAVGRTALVNGDPISVEESLVNHAPQYFTTMMNKVITQPIAEPEKLLMDKPDKSFAETMWHQFQTHKGYFEAGAALAENGLTWAVISKTINASLGASGAAGDFATFVRGILGVSGSAASFLELAEKFTAKPPALEAAKSIAKLANIGKYPLVADSIAKIADTAKAYVIPERMNIFMTRHASKLNNMSKAVNGLLGTPLSVIETIYSMNNAWDLSKQTQGHESKFSSLTTDYTLRTQSTSNQMSMASKAEFEKKQQQIKETKENLEKALKNHKLIDENRVLSVTDRLEDSSFTVQLINAGFTFDKSQVKPDEKSEQILSTIAAHLSELLDPISITVIGHTCFIGSDEYNYALSLRRAEAFKQAILDLLTCSEPLKDIWKARIKVVGKGETEPLFNNHLLTERYRNRRVEVEFLFNTSYQYPPCRSGISAIESRRRATVAANVAEEAEWINAASSAFDIALGIGAGFLGPFGVTAYALWWTGTTVNTGMDIFNSLTNKSFDSYAELKKYSEFGIVTQSMLVNNDGENDIAAFIKKGYLKRALAINGLVRLIHRYHYEKNAKNTNKDFTTSGMLAEYKKIPGSNTVSSFLEYDFEGYINHFLLDDSWEIAHDFIPVFLDEVWLQNLKNKGQNNRNVNDHASLQSYISGGIYLKNRLLQTDDSKEHLAAAQNFQSYFPIHFLSSKNLNYFKEMFVEKMPKFKKDVIKHVIISARPRGNVDVNAWQPLGQYLRSNERTHGSLSPYDQIRILVVFNNENSDFSQLIAQDAPLMIPVSVKPVRINSFSNDEGNTSTEYVKELRANDLCRHEKTSIKYDEESDDKVFGATINPTFLMGANIVPGTRPIANYIDATLEALFADEKVEGHKTKHSAVSGLYAMNYFYQLFILGSDVNNRISYGSKGHGRHKRSQCVFPLTLDPERKYKVKVKDKYIELMDDHLFYEKNFLLADNTNQPTCPVVFDEPRVELFVEQHSKRLKPSDDRVGIKFDWNTGSELLVIVYSKSIDTEYLVAQDIDADILPVKVELLTKSSPMNNDDEHVAELTQSSGIHRLGTIKASGKNCEFEPVIIDDSNIKIPVYEKIKREFSSKSSDELSPLRVIDKDMFDKVKSLFSDEVDSDVVYVDTDVFAIKIPLEYINAVGKKMPGLKPVPTLNLSKPYVYRDDLYLKLRLFSAKGAGLDGTLSSQLILQKEKYYINPSVLNKTYTDTTIPSNWIEHSEQNKENAIAMLQTNDDSNLDIHKRVEAHRDMKVDDDFVPAHRRNKLMEWVDAGGKDDTKEITPAREVILKAWIKGGPYSK